MNIYTQGQNNSDNWKSHRVGRITASSIHRVLTKVKTLERQKDSINTVLLVKQLTEPPSSHEKCTPAMKYGQEMEDEARAMYIK